MKKFNRAIVTLLVAVLFVAALTVSSHAAVSTVNNITFAAGYYTGAYSDIRAAFGTDTTAAQSHFANSGVREGRTGSVLFDVRYYLANNTDLRNAFGSDYEAAYNHFLEFGIREGRASSEFFDVQYYVNAYSDLKAAFGTNYAAAYDHFINNGMGEGRVGSTFFNAKAYLAANSDVANAYGGANYAGAYEHFVGFGKTEGRATEGTVNFDAKAYVEKYPDLKAAFGDDYTAAYNHYIEFGMGEGRTCDTEEPKPIVEEEATQAATTAKAAMDAKAATAKAQVAALTSENLTAAELKAVKDEANKAIDAAVTAQKAAIDAILSDTTKTDAEKVAAIYQAGSTAEQAIADAAEDAKDTVNSTKTVEEARNELKETITAIDPNEYGVNQAAIETAIDDAKGVLNDKKATVKELTVAKEKLEETVAKIGTADEVEAANEAALEAYDSYIDSLTALTKDVKVSTGVNAPAGVTTTSKAYNKVTVIKNAIDGIRADLEVATTIDEINKISDAKADNILKVVKNVLTALLDETYGPAGAGVVNPTDGETYVISTDLYDSTTAAVVKATDIAAAISAYERIIGKAEIMDDLIEATIDDLEIAGLETYITIMNADGICPTTDKYIDNATDVPVKLDTENVATDRNIAGEVAAARAAIMASVKVTDLETALTEGNELILETTRAFVLSELKDLKDGAYGATLLLKEDVYKTTKATIEAATSTRAIVNAYENLFNRESNFADFEALKAEAELDVEALEADVAGYEVLGEAEGTTYADLVAFDPSDFEADVAAASTVDELQKAIDDGNAAVLAATKTTVTNMLVNVYNNGKAKADKCVLRIEDYRAATTAVNAATTVQEVIDAYETVVEEDEDGNPVVRIDLVALEEAAEEVITAGLEEKVVCFGEAEDGQMFAEILGAGVISHIQGYDKDDKETAVEKDIVYYKMTVKSIADVAVAGKTLKEVQTAIDAAPTTIVKELKTKTIAMLEAITGDDVNGLSFSDKDLTNGKKAINRATTVAGVIAAYKDAYSNRVNEDELDNYKDGAVLNLDYYQDFYTINTRAYNSIVNSAVRQIDAAKSQAVVDTIVTETMEALKDIDRDDEVLLTDYQIGAVDNIENYVDPADYTKSARKLNSIISLYSNQILDIEVDDLYDPTDLDEFGYPTVADMNAALDGVYLAIDALVDNAKDAIDLLQTDAEITEVTDLKTAKTNAVNTLKDYARARKDDTTIEENLDDITAALNDGVAAINAVTVIENVDTELTTAKNAIKAVKTDAQELAAVKKAEKDFLTDLLKVKIGFTNNYYKDLAAVKTLLNSACAKIDAESVIKNQATVALAVKNVTDVFDGLVADDSEFLTDVVTALQEYAYGLKGSTIKTEIYNAAEPTFDVAYEVAEVENLVLAINKAIKDSAITKIEVTTAPDKTDYDIGDNFDTTGMVVTATYSNGDTAEVNGYVVTPAGALADADEFVTVSYAGKTAIVPITVD